MLKNYKCNSASGFLKPILGKSLLTSSISAEYLSKIYNSQFSGGIKKVI